MSRRDWTRYAALALVLALPACTADGDAPAASETPAPWTADPTAPEPRLEDPGPVADDEGYRSAVAALGAEEVAAALGRAARVARLALADCAWWADRTVHPELTVLLTPDHLAAVQADVSAKPRGAVRMLLDDLPVDDGNGHALATDLADGCDADGPLLHGPGIATVHLDGAAGEPALVVEGHYGTNVTLGESRVSANQDWVFTMVRTPRGWQVDDAVPSATTNWAPWRG